MDQESNQMSFLNHLEELRWRLVRSGIAIMVFALLAFIFKDIVFDQIILAPMQGEFITYRFFCNLGEFIGVGKTLCMHVDFELQNISMSGQFSSHIMVSVVAGLVVAFPYVFFELWSFILPGLKGNEKMLGRSLVFFTSLLFLGGVLFGYYIISPLSIQFLGGYQVSESVQNTIALNSYISTITSATLASGLLFQLPIVIYFLSRLGLVTPQFLRKYRKHAIVGVLVVSAIITPPDITSQILVSLPLLVLYELSIFISKIVNKREMRKKSQSR